MSLMILVQFAIIEYDITVMAPLSFTMGSTNITQQKPRLVLKLLSTCLIGDSESAYFSFKLAMNVSFCQNVFLAC